MKIEISDEFVEELIRASLKESLLVLCSQIKKYRNKKRLSEWEQNELDDCYYSLDHLEKTYEYYGGNLNERD